MMHSSSRIFHSLKASFTPTSITTTSHMSNSAGLPVLAPSTVSHARESPLILPLLSSSSSSSPLRLSSRHVCGSQLEFCSRQRRRSNGSPHLRASAVSSGGVPKDFTETAAGEAGSIQERIPDAKLTYLEGNSWQWEVSGVTILIDPIIVGPLDFGIPWLYSAFKRVLSKITLEDVADAEYLLITQSLDDHCHLNTLRPLSALRPNIPVVATPNAEPLLAPLFSNVTYLEPGQETSIVGKNGAELKVTATKGPILGPPWQRPENGYIVKSVSSGLSIYIEPHCGFTEEVGEESADVVVTPVVKQELPSFTLVSGQEDAVRLATLLKAKYVVPMANGDLDASGLLSQLVQSSGTLSAFKELLKKELPSAEVLEPIPGKPVCISLLENKTVG